MESVCIFVADADELGLLNMNIGEFKDVQGLAQAE